VLDILLARPHHLHRTVDLLRDLNGADRTVSLEPPAKAAADQMIVDDDLLGRQTRRLCGHPLQPRHGLAADPDFAFILAKMHRAVHRLHRRMREERHLVARLDLGRGAGDRLVGIAHVLRNCARAKRRLIELTHDRLRVEPGMGTFVPFDLERCKALLRSSHVIGHDCDGVVQPDDLTNALDGLRRPIVDALDASAVHRRLRERRDLHAGRPGIDAIDRRPVDLAGRVEPLRACTDQLEIGWRFERHTRRRRQLGGFSGQVTVAQPTARRHIAARPFFAAPM
jgi:hypothetical protein